ncbi:hypothetical protein L195_g052502 [Trifolium pratense]|uniref:Uncharacterized protein n=1 Tax=Trifolium pratense TaxID=57577 RepID=A0A2K3K5F4_TRIPR|nr:hypothetical protein L195_g052502 [Trifolium pratense]
MENEIVADSEEDEEPIFLEIFQYPMDLEIVEDSMDEQDDEDLEIVANLMDEQDVEEHLEVDLVS